MRSTIGAFGLAILAISCTAPTRSSEVQHSFGKTRRDPKKPFETCQTSTPGDSALATAQSYVQRIAYYIMKKNPQTFDGDLAPEKFCFQIVDSATVNASAAVESRLITFYRGIFDVMQNDGQIAAVMAHELAHVSMYHAGGIEKEEVENDPRWQSESGAIKQRIQSLKANEMDLYQRSDSLRNEKDNLETSLSSKAPDALRQKQAELENTFNKITDQAMAAIPKQKNPSSFYALLSRLKPVQPRIPESSSFEMDEGGATSAELQTLQSAVEKYHADRDAWLAEEQKALSQLWNTYSNLSTQINDISKQLEQNYINVEKAQTDLNDLRNSVLGSGAQNWMEKEADDVGLEFFLRANLAPLNFQGIFEHFAAQDKRNIASCAVQNNNHTPERGVGTHPDACWRYYNAQVLEMQDHAADYKQFIDKAIEVEIISGELSSLKKMLEGRAPSWNE